MDIIYGEYLPRIYTVHLFLWECWSEYVNDMDWWKLRLYTRRN